MSYITYSSNKSFYIRFHLRMVVFLYTFSQHIMISEGIQCYYCTDFPKTPGYYEGCGKGAELRPNFNSSTTVGLLHECRLLNVSNSSMIFNQNEIEGFEEIFYHPYNRREITNKSLRLETVPPNPITSIGSGGWLCAKVVASLQLAKDKAPKKFVLRGCVYAAAIDTLSDRCEDIDNKYTFGNVSASNAKICFCNGNGCNSGKVVDPAKSALIVSLLLQLFSLHSII